MSIPTSARQVATRITGADALKHYLATSAIAIQAVVDTKVIHFSQVLQTRIMAKASGRPGPNAPTGDYRRSWTVGFRRVAGVMEGEVGTNKPQGRRLEFGFHGADSLGRVYDQPPYPHVQPAVDEVMPEFVAALEAELAKL